MSQWHYHVEKYTFRELVKPEYLNSLGEAGWELICLKRLTEKQTAAQMRWLAVFKKKLVDKEG